MKKTELLKQYSIIPSKLLDYGFTKKLGAYIYEKMLVSDLNVVFTISKESITVDVYEKNTKEPYLPFYIKNAEGIYLLDLKQKIELELKNIIDHCFQKIDMIEQLLSYAKDKYQTIPEYPWKDSPTFCTLKTNKKQKWYGLFMQIPYKVLGLKKEGLVAVVNLKNDFEVIEPLIDHKHFFPAYHMNKKHWFSVLLDNELDINIVKKLLDESYQSVENK